MNKKIRGFLIVVLCIIFFCSTVLVLKIIMGYRITNKLYKDLAARFTITVEKDEEVPEEMEQRKEGVAPIIVDFDALQIVNEDIVGWIYCEDTDINYPVLQGRDNDFYLYHTYDGASNRAGSIFVEAHNTPNFVDSNTIIYGHHMKDGSMFATLRNWADQEYYEKHPIFWLLTPEQNYQLLLFSGYTTTGTSDTYTIYQGSCQEFDEYLKAVYVNSDFSSDVKIDSGERFVVLSTCEYDFEDARYVLHGMLVSCDP